MLASGTLGSSLLAVLDGLFNVSLVDGRFRATIRGGEGDDNTLRLGLVVCLTLDICLTLVTCLTTVGCLVTEVFFTTG